MKKKQTNKKHKQKQKTKTKQKHIRVAFKLLSSSRAADQIQCYGRKSKHLLKWKSYILQHYVREFFLSLVTSMYLLFLFGNAPLLIVWGPLLHLLLLNRSIWGCLFQCFTWPSGLRCQSGKPILCRFHGCGGGSNQGHTALSYCGRISLYAFASPWVVAKYSMPSHARLPLKRVRQGCYR